MDSQYMKFDGKSRFLARLCNKSYGNKSHRQRVELERERDNNRDIRIAMHSNSATQFLRYSEIE
jgi:hypothetical protein